MIRLVLALLLLAVPAGSQAQEIAAAESADRLAGRAADAVAVLRGERPPEEVFTPTFLAAVPADRLAAMSRDMNAQFGAMTGVESVTPGANPGSAVIVLRFERALADGEMQLEANEPQRIAGLLITNFRLIADTAQRTQADLAALPGETAIYLAPLDGGEPLLSHNADQQLAIGSTFKLYVLSSLARSIREGRHRWDEVVRLGEKSFPSGELQGWPDGAPLTLQTLATLMISISDNTATDQLIRLLGREAVEAEIAAAGHAKPRGNTPLLTTREMFALKAPSRAGLAADFQAGDTAVRRSVLERLAPEEVSLAEVNAALAAGPRLLGIEWFASTLDLTAVLRRLRDLGDPVVMDILSVEPAASQAERARWAYIGYKGGSEPGVLNFTWLLRSRTGDWYALAMSWNIPEAALDQTTFELLARRAMALVPGG
ncbi:class A beta-lactamase [Altererythrobacter sp. B11]|uniref:serine hydrolase n=1 Tax=Altererythrobacter sp. B11 TaxID=2060312 RepID=UPI000DC73524|nr:serine hydrolase [Altererythrobacter sp. B11]BBC73093.1 class A beta-lactamase [Altererythrobacter sp. B11]